MYAHVQESRGNTVGKALGLREVLRFDGRVAHGVDNYVAMKRRIADGAASRDACGETLVAVGKVEQRGAGHGLHHRGRHQATAVRVVAIPATVSGNAAILATDNRSASDNMSRNGFISPRLINL